MHTHSHDTHCKCTGEQEHGTHYADENEAGCSCCSGQEPEDIETWDMLTLAIGFVMLVQGILWGEYISETKRWIFFGVPYLVCGYPVLAEAWHSIRKGRFFDEFTLMGGATVAAICLGELSEALGVMIFYRVGEMFQEHAAGVSRKSIRGLIATKPSTANVVRGDEIVVMAPEDIKAGARVRVKAGEKIPVDGIVVSGSSRVDTSPITGEHIPVRAEEGVKVFGGTISLDGTLTVEASGPFKDSEIARVMEIVENAAARKSPTERFITRFAAVYTPAMFGVALLTAVIPPLLLSGSWYNWIYRSLVVLMISCPCALVISIPLGYFGGIGAASKRGILVKGGNVLDAANEVGVVAFDKTGTLTRGVFEVVELRISQDSTDEELKRAASIAESNSNHPVARSIQKAFGSSLVSGTESREVAGKGAVTTFEGEEYAAGNLALMEELGIAAQADDAAGTIVYIARQERFLGSIAVSDIIKADAVRAIARLKERGIKSYMLTGDREEGAAWVAEKLKLDGYRSALLPEMKISALEELAGETKTAFVGDGVNDAPLLASAHVGVAMGGLGSEAAIEVADAVVLNDAPSRVVDLIDISKRTHTIVRQNIAMALGTKAVFMLLGIVGIAGLWEAIFADVGVALLAVLNATRTGRL